jgi:hypothetical protein
MSLSRVVVRLNLMLVLRSSFFAAADLSRWAFWVMRGVERMTDKLEQNKQTVTAFYDLIFNQGQPAEAIEKYVGDVYIQHKPAVVDEK